MPRLENARNVPHVPKKMDDPPGLSEVGDRLWLLRKHERFDYTQDEVAQKSGDWSEEPLPRTDIVNIERGKNNAGSARTIFGLAAAFNLDPFMLYLYLDGSMELEDLIGAHKQRHKPVKLRHQSRASDGPVDKPLRVAEPKAPYSSRSK